MKQLKLEKINNFMLKNTYLYPILFLSTIFIISCKNTDTEKEIKRMGSHINLSEHYWIYKPYYDCLNNNILICNCSVDFKVELLNFVKEDSCIYIYPYRGDRDIYSWNSDSLVFLPSSFPLQSLAKLSKYKLTIRDTILYISNKDTTFRFISVKKIKNKFKKKYGIYHSVINLLNFQKLCTNLMSHGINIQKEMNLPDTTRYYCKHMFNTDYSILHYFKKNKEGLNKYEFLSIEVIDNKVIVYEFTRNLKEILFSENNEIELNILYTFPLIEPKK